MSPTRLSLGPPRKHMKMKVCRYPCFVMCEMLRLKLRKERKYTASVWEERGNNRTAPSRLGAEEMLPAYIPVVLGSNFLLHNSFLLTETSWSFLQSLEEMPGCYLSRARTASINSSFISSIRCCKIFGNTPHGRINYDYFESVKEHETSMVEKRKT